MKNLHTIVFGAFGMSLIAQNKDTKIADKLFDSLNMFKQLRNIYR
jgi:hypothetical protein